MASITLKYDNIPDGQEIEVLYLGVFPNGATTDISDEQLATYENLTGETIEGSLTLPDDDVADAPVVPESSEPAVAPTPEGDEL